jgi:hypothetical protein
MMRYFWPTATLVLLVIAGFLYFRSEQGCEVTGGNTLYLNRLDVETTRARFCYAADCRMVAEQMSRVEQARWYCPLAIVLQARQADHLVDNVAFAFGIAAGTPCHFCCFIAHNAMQDRLFGRL